MEIKIQKRHAQSTHEHMIIALACKHEPKFAHASRFSTIYHHEPLKAWGMKHFLRCAIEYKSQKSLKN